MLNNTTQPRTDYEEYMRTLGDIGNAGKHERRRRAHSIIITTLWAFLCEMKRVNGCMLQRAQETIQYAVGFDMPEDTPAPRRLQLETAIKLLTDRCLVFETFH